MLWKNYSWIFGFCSMPFPFKFFPTVQRVMLFAQRFGKLQQNSAGVIRPAEVAGPVRGNLWAELTHSAVLLCAPKMYLSKQWFKTLSASDLIKPSVFTLIMFAKNGSSFKKKKKRRRKKKDSYFQFDKSYLSYLRKYEGDIKPEVVGVRQCL